MYRDQRYLYEQIVVRGLPIGIRQLMRWKYLDSEPFS